MTGNIQINDRNLHWSKPSSSYKHNYYLDTTAKGSGWQAFDEGHKPELDREFHIENSPDPEFLNVYRIHREGMHLAALQLRMADGSWKEVGYINAAWLIKHGKWRYLTSKETK